MSKPTWYWLVILSGLLFFCLVRLNEQMTINEADKDALHRLEAAHNALVNELTKTPSFELLAKPND